MDKEMIKIYITYIGIYGSMILLVWFGAYKISAMTEEVSIIEPEIGIKCAVVSRTFNTSIDCWKD